MGKKRLWQELVELRSGRNGDGVLRVMEKGVEIQGLFPKMRVLWLERRGGEEKILGYPPGCGSIIGNGFFGEVSPTGPPSCEF